MKISIFSAFYPFRGGIAQFNSLLYRSLEKKHDVKAITFKRQYPNFLFPGKTQYVTKEDDTDAINSIQTLDSMNPLSYLKTAKTINKQQPELYISNYWMTFFGPAMGIISRRLQKNIKQIAILHNVIPHEKRFFDQPFTKFFLKKTEGFVVMSDAVLKDLLSIKKDAKYIRLDHPIYNHFGSKIDQQEAQHKLNMSTDKKTLLFFGIIRDYKGLDLLIQAMNLLDESYQLIIAGEVYGSFEKYQQLIDQSGAKARIHLFNHYISDEDVSIYFSASDVCILPYKSATQSGITAISNHFTIPIIATDVGGLKETIRHLETGLIVEKPEAELITNAIQSYFSSENKNLFSTNISLENNQKTWDNFSERLIAFAETL